MEEITLEEWTNHYHSTEEMRELFCAQSAALKRTHQYGYYVTDFNLNQILVGNQQAHQYVIFKEVKSLPNGEEKKAMMQRNIQTECFQEIGIYCSMLSDMTIEFTPSFLKENFDRFSPFLPEQDFSFYKKVFVYDSMIYLTDFVAKRAEREVTQLESQLKEENGGRPLNKSTPQGRAMAETANNAPFLSSDNTSQSAFVYTFVLPFVIFALSLLIPLFSMIFGSLS